MIAGADAVQALPEIAIPGGSCLILLLTAARLFRWIEVGQRYKDDVSYVASYAHAGRWPLCLSAAFFYVCLIDHILHL